MVAHHRLRSEISHGHRRFVLFVNHSTRKMSGLHSAAQPAGLYHSLQSHTTFQFITHDVAPLGSF
jgi:hypothetical protein